MFALETSILSDSKRLIKPIDHEFLVQNRDFVFETAFDKLRLQKRITAAGDISWSKFNAAMLSQLIPNLSDVEYVQRIFDNNDNTAMVEFATRIIHNIRSHRSDKNYGWSLYHRSGAVLGNGEALTVLASVHLRMFHGETQNVFPSADTKLRQMSSEQLNLHHLKQTWNYLNCAAEAGWVSLFMLNLLDSNSTEFMFGDYSTPLLQSIKLASQEIRERTTAVVLDQWTESSTHCNGKLCGIGKPTEFVCGRCLTERYCSENCQQHDWNVHKFLCLGCSPTLFPISVESLQLLPVLCSVKSDEALREARKLSLRRRPILNVNDPSDFQEMVMNENGSLFGKMAGTFMEPAQVDMISGFYDEKLIRMLNYVAEDVYSRNFAFDSSPNGMVKTFTLELFIRLCFANLMVGVQTSSQLHLTRCVDYYIRMREAFDRAFPNGAIPTRDAVKLSILKMLWRKAGTAYLKLRPPPSDHRSLATPHPARSLPVVPPLPPAPVGAAANVLPAIRAPPSSAIASSSATTRSTPVVTAAPPVNQRLTITNQGVIPAPLIPPQILNLFPLDTPDEITPYSRPSQSTQQQDVVRAPQTAAPPPSPQTSSQSAVTCINSQSTYDVILCQSLAIVAAGGHEKLSHKGSTTHLTDNCTICLTNWNKFTDCCLATVLPCGHAFCLSCLYGQINSVNFVGAKFPCGVCRQEESTGILRVLAEEVVNRKMFTAFDTLVEHISPSPESRAKCVVNLLLYNHFNVNKVQSALFQMVATITTNDQLLSNNTTLSSRDKAAIYERARAPVLLLQSEQQELVRKMDHLAGVSADKASWKGLMESHRVVTEQLTNAELNAASDIYERINNQNGGLPFSGGIIPLVDLHGLHNEEARAKLEDLVFPVLPVFSSMILITGGGNNSKNRKKKGRKAAVLSLKDGVIEFLKLRGYRWEKVNGNEGRIRLLPK